MDMLKIIGVFHVLFKGGNWKWTKKLLVMEQIRMLCKIYDLSHLTKNKKLLTNIKKYGIICIEN
jgi:hypothetical protein